MCAEIKGSHLVASSGNKDFPNRPDVTVTTKNVSCYLMWQRGGSGPAEAVPLPWSVPVWALARRPRSFGFIGSDCLRDRADVEKPIFTG